MSLMYSSASDVAAGVFMGSPSDFKLWSLNSKSVGFPTPIKQEH